jgi:transposase
MDRASLEQLLGQGLSLAEIGRRFGKHEATVGYWVKKYGLQAANRDKHVARGGLAREDLEPLIERGMSIAQIAEAVKCSKGTVRHWLRQYGLKTQAQRRSLDRLRACRDGEVRAVVRQLPRGGGGGAHDY